MNAGSVVQSASFVDGAAGSRFRMLSEPRDRRPRGTVVFVHAFAEEMNKSRRMAARMARLLAGAGWRVVQRDLSGCGDSAGDFSDATWAAWCDDVVQEVSQADPNQPLWLWCQRAGALLVPAALARRPDAHLLLWQPVLSGTQHLQQFLRLHAGARIVGSAKADAGGPSPLQRLRAGERVEVAGYALGPGLAAGMEQAAFDVPEGFAGRIEWFEVGADDEPSLSPQATRTAERLRARGVGVEARIVRGPLFWQTQEIEDCDELLAATLARLGDPPAAPPRSRDPAARRVATSEHGGAR